MADLTRAQMIDRVLEHIGVLAAGQSASATDAARVGEAIDSAHERLRKLELAPFATSAIPPWAQTLLRDYVAGDVGRLFGFGDSFKPAQVAAERELHRQCSGYRQLGAIPAKYY